jgi:hypothetical protein
MCIEAKSGLILCLHECSQTASGAFAKLTLAQRFCERFQVRNAIYEKVLKFRIRGSQKVVIGKTGVQSGQSALILIATGKIVD